MLIEQKLEAELRAGEETNWYEMVWGHAGKFCREYMLMFLIAGGAED